MRKKPKKLSAKKEDASSTDVETRRDAEHKSTTQSATEELSKMLGTKLGILCEDNDGELESKIRESIKQLGICSTQINDLESAAVRAREKVNALDEAAARVRHELSAILKASAEARKEVSELEREVIQKRSTLVSQAQESNALMTTRFCRLRVRASLYNINKFDTNANEYLILLSQ